MSEYIGREPVTSLFNTDTFTGNDGPTYTLTYSPGSVNSILVFIDGVYQMPGVSNAYIVSNKTLTFSENVSSLSTIFVLYLGLSAAIGTPGTGTVDFPQLSSTILPPGVIWDYAGSSAPSGWVLCNGVAISRSSFSGLFTAIGTVYGVGDGSTTFNVPDFRGRMAVGAGKADYTFTILPAGVNTGTNKITVTANDVLRSGTPLLYTTTGTAIGGLVSSTVYYAAFVLGAPTQMGLCTTLAQAQNGTPIITLSSQGTGIHTFSVNNYVTKTLGAVGGEESHAMTIDELLAHSHTGAAQTGATASAGAAVLSSANTGSTGGNNPFNLLSPYTVINKIIKT